MESTFHKRALHEYNMSLPAYRPFFRYEQLPASTQSRIDERARQLAIEALAQHVAQLFYLEASDANTEPDIR
jgi:hypothetical protein